MTVQPTRDQLRALAEKHIAGQLALGAPVNAGWLNAPTALTLLDQLDQAEARIKAVRDELAAWDDAPEGSVMPVHGAADLIRRALEG